MKNLSMLKNCTIFEELCVETDQTSKDIHFKDDKCPKPCKITQFTGEVVERDLKIEDTLQSMNLMFIYSSSTIAVEEEYRIYDFFAMVGSIGGSLGLCVGFSIFDTFSMIIDKVFST